MILPRRLYHALITNAAKHGIDRFLGAGLVMRESRWNPNAIGDNGHSVGLGQLHDEGAGAGMSVEDRKDPDRNLDVAFAYLRRLLDNTPTIPDALSAYNQGFGGWEDRGILESQRAYIQDILNYTAQFREEGITPDTGDYDPPPPSGDPGDVVIQVPAGTTRIIIQLLGAIT